jgi:hypothetical protein
MNSSDTSTVFAREQAEEMRRARKAWTLKDPAKAQQQAVANRAARLKTESVMPDLTVYRVLKS